MAHVHGWEYNRVVGYPWSLRPNGFPPCTYRVITLRRVKRDQQKRDVGSDRIRWIVHCPGSGTYLDKLRFVDRSQRQLRGSHKRRSEGSICNGGNLPVLCGGFQPLV